MHQKYRVFKAMRELGDFTVSRLVDASGVTPQTIRTILMRYREWVTKDADRIETGRPGGQFTRYRLTEKGGAALDRELETLTSGPERSRQKSELPVTLLTANDTLSRRLPEAHTPERRRFLLDTVKSDLEAARARIEGGKAQGFDTTEATAELQSIERMYKFSETGALPRDTAIEMKGVMLWLRSELNTTEWNWQRQIPWAKLRQAAERFEARFEPFLPKQGAGDNDVLALAAQMNRQGDSFIVEPRVLPYFGIAPSVYARGVLHDLNKASNRSVQEGELRVFIPAFLESINHNRSSISTPFELEIAKQLKAVPLPNVAALSDSGSPTYVDVYSAYAGR